MHGRPRKQDSTQNALRVVEHAMGEPPNHKPEAKKPILFPHRTKTKNLAAVALGKLRSVKGGKARAVKLFSAEEKQATAKRSTRGRVGPEVRV
jgi:hypothetical protein